ncbi:MAG: ABC transporter ATP-binding protein [Ignisphaera sp.]|nr:ABC transporter ATP-binding protein [Ignisphaera sp.]MDW8084753.1 ABC transporter ATP-binding protein [Ignisphaera sp.]
MALPHTQIGGGGLHILVAEDIDGGYTVPNRGVFIHAVDGVSLTLERNEVLGIAGESGCGKSTLAKIIYGAVEPPLTVRRGRVLIEAGDKGFIDMLSCDRDTVRREIMWKTLSYIPQNSMNVLNPMKRIRDHFIETFKFHGMEIGKRDVVNYIREVFNSVGLPVDAINAYPHQLSGGMRQRIVIALALMLRPRVVLADEPTTAVDVVTQLGILSFLKEWQRSNKCSIIVISHDMGVHAYMDDRIAIMYAGNIVEYGEAEKVFMEPLHPYTKLLIESLIKRGERTLKKGILGSPPNLANPPPGCRFHPRCPYAMDVCRREEPPETIVGSRYRVRCWLYSRDGR